MSFFQPFSILVAILDFRIRSSELWQTLGIILRTDFRIQTLDRLRMDFRQTFDSRLQTSNFGLHIYDFRQTLGRFRTDFGHQTSDFGVWTSVLDFWETPDFGYRHRFWTSDFCFWTPGFKHTYVVDILETYFRQFLDSGQTSDIRLRISVFQTDFIGLHQTLDCGL